MNIEKFTNKLTGYGFEWVILGGYPRDLHHGRKPKDLDIIIYNTDYISKGVMNDFESEMYEHTYKEHDSSHSNDGRISKVLTYKIEDTVVDIIFWNPIYKTVDSVIKAFDYNINQYHFNPSNHVTTFLGENEGIVTRVGGNCPDTERKMRIAQVASDIGWKLSEDFFIQNESDIPF